MLRQQVRWHFDETPLEEAAAATAAGLGMDVYLDRPALDDMGIDYDTPISLPSGRYVAEDALRRILHPKELTYVIANGGLMITTRETSEMHLENAVYDVTDLMMERLWDFAAMTKCMATVIQPTTWDWVGGPGAAEAVFDKRSRDSRCQPNPRGPG